MPPRPDVQSRLCGRRAHVQPKQAPACDSCLWVGALLHSLRITALRRAPSRRIARRCRRTSGGGGGCGSRRKQTSSSTTCAAGPSANCRMGASPLLVALLCEIRPFSCFAGSTLHPQRLQLIAPRARCRLVGVLVEVGLGRLAVSELKAALGTAFNLPPHRLRDRFVVTAPAKGQPTCCLCQTHHTCRLLCFSGHLQLASPPPLSPVCYFCPWKLLQGSAWSAFGTAQLAGVVIHRSLPQ